MADPSFYDSDWQPVMYRYSELQSMMAKWTRGALLRCVRVTRLGRAQRVVSVTLSVLRVKMVTVVVTQRARSSGGSS